MECFVDGINFGIFYIYDNIKEIWEVGDVKNVFYDDYNNIIIVFNIKFLCWKKNIDMGKHHFSKIQYMFYLPYVYLSDMLYRGLSLLE